MLVFDPFFALFFKHRSTQNSTISITAPFLCFILIKMFVSGNYSLTAWVTTSEINPSLTFVLWHIVILFHKNLYTYSQVNVRLWSIYGRRRRTSRCRRRQDDTIIGQQIYVLSYTKAIYLFILKRPKKWFTLTSTVFFNITFFDFNTWSIAWQSFPVRSDIRTISVWRP